MFPGACHEQVEGPFFGGRLDRGRQRQIQRLCPSRCKNDIFGRDPGKSGHLGTGSFDYRPRGSPFGMNGGGVTAKIEGRAHRLARRGMQGRRGVMVKVNTRARHERIPQPQQRIESREQATRLLLMLAIQKSLQSIGAYVLEDPPGSPDFAEPASARVPCAQLSQVILRRRATRKVKRTPNAANARQESARNIRQEYAQGGNRRIVRKIHLIV
jgi:hypothetical protein